MTDNKLKNCAKCGMCLYVCPVYSALNEEQASPRARMHLIDLYRSDEMTSTPKLKEMISKCLMCGSCSGICPLGIDHYTEFVNMRRQMVAEHGESAGIKSLVYLLAREYRRNMAVWLARWGQKLAPEIFKKKYKLGNIPLKKMPVFNDRPFIDQMLNPTSKQMSGLRQPDRPKGNVIYFTGCATQFLFDDTGHATVKILQKLGYMVTIPKNQTCCSIPMLFHGAVEEAGDNIRKNIEVLSSYDADAIVVDCPTCGEALKHEYLRLCHELNLDRTAVERIASKVIDISSFISEKADDQTFRKRGDQNRLSVMYHLPCHLKNSFDNPNVTPDLLYELPTIEYTPVPDMDACCGGGGCFFYEYPEVSGLMVESKIKNAQGCSADYWVTECPVCRINLSGNLPDDSNVSVTHPAVLLGKLL